MKTILLLATICLISFNLLSQYEDDTSYYQETNLLLDYSKWKIDTILPDGDNADLDSLTKIMYNTYVNMDVLDSIISYRSSKGFKTIKRDYPKDYEKVDQSMIYHSMDISKLEKSEVVLVKFEDPNPDCDCALSIIQNILSDSVVDNKNKPFKNLILNNNVKNIEINYYQVSRKDNPDAKEEHIIIKIKRRFRLFKDIYDLI